MSMEDVCSCPNMCMCVCVCKRDKFSRDRVCDNNEVYNHSKSPIVMPSCLKGNGEVITKGSYCVIYVTI